MKPLTKNQRKKLKKKLKKQQEREKEKEGEGETGQNVPEMEVNGDKSPPTSPSAESGAPSVAPGNSDPGKNVPVVVNGGRGASVAEDETRPLGGNWEGVNYKTPQLAYK